jgi:transcriptional regulator with XRE-family HTH domain
MRFSKLLAVFREQSGLKKNQLAKRMGVSEGYVRNLESGRAKPATFDRVDQIIKILSLPKEDGLRLKEAAAMERIHPEDKRFLENSREIEISDVDVPIVSAVGATDDLGRTSFTPYDPPYKTISFKVSDGGAHQT